jgi:hypothetical protein
MALDTQYGSLIIQKRDVAIDMVEDLKIINHRLVLTEIPNSLYKVNITNYVEKDYNGYKLGTKLNNNEFVVDYGLGIVIFADTVLDNTSVHVVYKGMGYIQYPASRIYYHNEQQDTIDNLQDIINESIPAVQTVNDLTAKITEGNTLKTNLENDIASGNTVKSNLDSSITTANSTKTALDTSNTNANNTKINLDTSNSTAVTTKTNLDNTISTANTTKTNLDNSISTGNTLKTNLDTSNTNATNTKTGLDTSISSANTSKTNLDGSITSGNTLKTNLDTSITNATNINNTLGVTITNGQTKIDTIDNFKHLGTYVGATAYVPRNMVEYNGSTYVCILNSTGNLPTNTTYWKLFASKGTDGAGNVLSVNGYTGTVVLNAGDVGAISSTIPTVSGDLNTYVTTGMYYVPTSTTNAPTTSAYNLIVISNGTNVTQIAHLLGTSNYGVQTRSSANNGSTWNSWVREIVASDFTSTPSSSTTTGLTPNWAYQLGFFDSSYTISTNNGAVDLNTTYANTVFRNLTGTLTNAPSGVTTNVLFIQYRLIGTTDYIQHLWTNEANPRYFTRAKTGNVWGNWMQQNDFNSLANKPTTLSGYGITDALSTSGGTISGLLTLSSTLTLSNTNISYTDGTTGFNVMRFKNGNSNGHAVGIGAGGSTLIGGGESVATVMNDATNGITDATKETLYLTSDDDVQIWTNIQAGITSAKKSYFDKLGNLVVNNTISEGGTLLSSKYQPKYTTGTSAPSVTPTSVGLIYIDTTNQKAYISTGTSVVSDWEQLDQVDWTNILNKPSTFTPSAHTHVVADITDLSTNYYNKTQVDAKVPSNKITVSSTQPSSPALNDIWIQV